uniref:Uncharacterized protein n=1 Tax=Avena sativa TaxID=4498 RepID=A0ACD5Y7B3_AVESA
MDFSTDVLVEILLRLPTSARRRARLVCRLWREAVDERTTEMHSRAAKPLLWNTRTAVAYVDDFSSSSSPWSCTTEVWRSCVPCASSYGDADVQLVGTSNGLLCLCDNGGDRTGGAVTVVNPATGETLSLPLLPCTDERFGGRRSRRWDKAYSFGYHPTSGRYKVVHVPCRFDGGYFDLDGVCDFDALQVLELGEEASWREVPAPADARCNLEAGVTSIDGATYWVTEGGGDPRVASLSLDDDERVVTFALPFAALSAGPPDNYRLAEVRGRLSVVVHDRSRSTTGVWVLEEKDTWTRRYSLHSQDLTQPHFVYGDEVVTHDGSSLYGHRRKSGPNLLCDVMKINAKDQGTLVARVWGETCFSRTFPYVQTTEPLGVYASKTPSTTALQGEGDLHRTQVLEHAQLVGLQGEVDLHRTQELEHAQLGCLQDPPRAAVAALAPMTLARVEPKALALVLLLTFFSLLLAFFSTCMHK